MHRGHVNLGRHIRDMFQLAEVLYILSAKPPHKSVPQVSQALRWEMLKRALDPLEGLTPCDIEMQRTSYSWTIDTVRELIRRNPSHQYYFISGSEGFLKIESWKDYRSLLAMLPFVVVIRDDTHMKPVQELSEKEGMAWCREISDPPHPPCLYPVRYQSETINFSSTEIRKRRARSLPVSHMVDGGVLKIMEENKLYESRTD